MSRIAERLARAEALLAEHDRVICVAIDIPRMLIGVLDGTVKTRAKAIEGWYRENRQEPTKEHLAEMKAGGVIWAGSRRNPRRNTRQRAEAGPGSTGTGSTGSTQRRRQYPRKGE
jgi:hypothetical protein